MIKTTLASLALAAALVLPTLADDGVMPQNSKIIYNKAEVQQGVPAKQVVHTNKRAHHAAKRHHVVKHHAGKKHHRAHHAKPAAK